MRNMQPIKQPSTAMVVLAFATVYLVWGSTYFFIQIAVKDIPPFIMGAMRFAVSGIILLAWSIFRKEDIWNTATIKTASIAGVLMLFIGTGAVIWVEQELPSSLVAILVSSSPLWFVLLDKPKWKENFSSRSIIISLIIGFIGVLLLFSQKVKEAFAASGGAGKIMALVIIIIGCISWVGGSLFSKYKGTGSATANATWQMLASAAAFGIFSIGSGELKTFHLNQVSTGAWLAIVYLITMGSLAGYSAYVWLLQVRPATQVSTYAYVNPVVAVILGVLFANERLIFLQVLGLAIILTSVLAINITKQRKERKEKIQAEEMKLALVEEDK